MEFNPKKCYAMCVSLKWEPSLAKKILTSVANSVEIDNRLLKLVGVCLTDLST